MLILFINFNPHLFDSHVGVQMQPVCISNPRSILNFLINLVFDLIIFYGHTKLDPFQLNALRSTCAITKPMFNYLVAIIDRFVYAGIFVINIVYAYFAISRVIHLLDSMHFYEFYLKGNKWRTIGQGFMGAHVVLFFLFFHDKINLRVPNLEDMIRYACMYQSLYQYWICGILHYSQYATYNLLLQIDGKLSPGRAIPPLEQFQLVSEIRSLAYINDELNTLLSIPTSVFILLNIFNITMFVSMAFLCTPNVGLLLHAFFSAFYLAYILNLNSRLLVTLNRIGHKLQNNSTFFRNGSVQSKNYLTRRVFSLHYLHTPNRRLASFLSESPECRQLRYQEFAIYQTYFTIKLFQMCKLNLTFLLSVALFICNYIVLITQTN